MTNEDLANLIKESQKEVLSSGSFSSDSLQEMISQTKKIDDLLLSIFALNIEYSTNLVYQVIKDLSEKGYLQVSDEDF